MKGIEGSTLGRYELRRRIAYGGMSEVYLGYDRRVRRAVAVKVLYGSDEPFVRRFEREALAVGTLSHDHILPLYDFGEQRPWYYLVMPFVEGGTLRDYLLKRERLTLEEAESFLYQIASALQHAHDHGVVHRDVKPSNILLRPDGHAYLVDFGLAKAKLESESLSHIGTMIGTPEYMAPEQSNGQNDYRSDIYSLGIILYQMLTGQVPFTAESPVATSLKHIQARPMPPSELNPEIPPAVEDVILKALAKEPDERYQQAKAFSSACRKAIYQARTRNLHSVMPLKQEAAHTGQEEPSEDAGTAVTIPRLEAIVSPKKHHEEDLDEINNKPPLFPLGADVPPFPSMPDVGKRKWRIYPLLIIILCLLLLGSVVLSLESAWQAHHPPGPTPSPVTPTKTTLSWETATAISHSNIQATLAAQSQAQATAGITTAIGAGKVLYANSMTSSGGGWIDDGSQCYFSAQGYHVYTALTHAVVWCYSNQQQYTDAIITAQARLLHGDIYGLMFRLNPDSKAFYVLELNSHSEYRFVRAFGRNPLQWLTLIDWTYSSSILSGYGSTNTILVVATGSHFRFYINKQLIVSSFIESSYLSGLIGFLVGGDSNGGAEAVFSNVWIFQKQPGS